MDDRTLRSLNERRQQIVEEIASITTMRRGSFCEWGYHGTLKDGTVWRRGPFYKITLKDKAGKTVSLAVPKDQKEHMRAEVARYQRFRKLADEYAEVCEQIALLTGQGKTAPL